jgi:hypothetical protein
MKSIYTHLAAMLTPVLVCLAWSLPTPVQAIHYTTLSDGNYYNTTNVWSTDGVTPCFCSPTDTNISGDTLDITAQILLGSNVTFQNGAVLHIYTTGSLYGNYHLLLDGSQVTNDGILSIGSLTQRGPAFFSSNNTLNVNPGDLTVEAGFFYLGTSSHVGGSLEVQINAFMVVLDNGILVVDGNYTNHGISNFRSGACITVLGDFASDYVVFGDGHIGAQGNFTNYGDWVSTISWCAGGVDSGVPGLEDCTTCGPLPVTIGKFEADYDLGMHAAALRWNSLLESNNEAFLLARSVDGKTFAPLTEVASTAPNGGGATYAHFDREAPEGDVWYQLSQRDRDGNVSILATQRVQVGARPTQVFQAWPNPFRDELHAGIGGDSPITLELRDVQGRLLRSQSATGTATLDLSTLPAGIYLLECQSGTTRELRRVTKQ